MRLSIWGRMRKGVVEEGVLVRDDSKALLIGELGTGQSSLTLLLNSCMVSDKLCHLWDSHFSTKWR